MGMDAENVENMFGKPVRIDESEFGYQWWIYKQDFSKYIQVGVANGKVVTLYAIGPDVNISPFVIGQPVNEIYGTVPIEPTVDLEFEGSSYRFELSENDMNTRPIVKMGEYYAQLNIDKFDGELSSVRFIDTETLIKLRPYELVYRGDLLEVEPSVIADESVISEGSRKQIFDITNIIRSRHQLPPLVGDDKLSEIASSHSRDMFETKEFSHVSETTGDLTDRLEAGEVFFQQAGENIAAHYADAPAVMEGWLNSKGHRETLLTEEFTHIGIGVFNRYYTQNFISEMPEALPTTESELGN